MPTITDDEPHPPPAKSIELELIDPLCLIPMNEHTQILSWAAAVFAQLNASGSVRVKVVNDEQMSDAHQRFSGIEGTTDVLTFDLNDHDDCESKILDTDLLVCFDEAARQASDRSHSTAHELLLYIIHGTLHCLGYNDHSTEDYNRMHAREDDLLVGAGIGPLFDRGTHE